MAIYSELYRITINELLMIDAVRHKLHIGLHYYVVRRALVVFYESFAVSTSTPTADNLKDEVTR